MKKHNVFLLFTSLTALLFCACSSELKEKENNSSKPGTVTLSIANDTQRTISPASGISYKDVSEWTVTFEDITKSRSEKYNDIVKTVSFSKSANQQIQLPLGTYNVTLNGTANNDTSGETATTQTVPFYGESTVTVEDGKSASISVLVAPKKSNGGTGSFNFEVITSGFGNYAPSMAFVDNSTDGENYFTVSLTPYGGENPVATWTPTEMSMTNSENGDIYSFSVSSGTPESIPSGFYTLSIEYTWVEGSSKKTKEIYYPYHDFLVEIVDECTTTGSVEITVSLEDSKIYYATTYKEKEEGNGAFESMPGYLDNVLDAVNKTTISTANIYIVDEVLTDETSTSYPEIDVSKVNATGKTYCIYTKSEKTQEYNSTPCYTITGAAIEGGEPTIDIERSVTTVTLKNSQSSSGISGSAKIVALGSPEFVLKDNTSVFIDLTDQNNQIACTTICMPPDSTTFDSYYVENPCVTVKNLSTTQTSFSVFVEQSLSNSYSVVTNSSDDGTYKTTNFYIIPSYTAELPVEGIPNYSLVATKGGNPTESTQFFVGDTVTITATSKSEGGSFADGTTFAWFINGEKIDCTAQSYEITFGVNAEASNTIICLVGYNGQYATAGINLSAQEKPIVLYNNTSDKTKPALSYATLTDVSSPTVLLAKDSEYSPEIVDYCFDDSNNLYAIVRKTETSTTYSINKYAYSNKYDASTVATYTIGENEHVSAIDYIEASSDGKLYAVITRSSDNTTSTSIAELNFTGSDETVGFTNEYALPSEWSSGDNTYYYIQTFCTDGTNFYVIVSITSSYNGQYETTTTKLVSCTVSAENNQLTENKSILLASTDEVDTPVFSSSDYNYDALEYRDLCYIDGKLYLLVRDVMIDGGNYTSYSRGALCTFTVKDNGEIESGKIIGYQKTPSYFPYTGYDTEKNTYPTITRTAYIGDVDSKLFYGPVKFVARKQDELIIADDGFSMISEASKDNSEKTQATVSSKNAVVTYNLNKESLNFVSLDGEYFEKKYSGYFYGSSFPGN